MTDIPKAHFLSYRIYEEVLKKTNFFSCLSILELPLCDVSIAKGIVVHLHT